MNQILKRITLMSICLWAASAAWAFRVTPTYQVFRLKPGTKTIGELTLTNTQDKDLLITPSAYDFYTLPENKKIKTTDWLHIENEEFSLKQGESKTIKFVVQAPKKAKGELAGNLRFESRSKQVGGVSLSLSLAIYAAISGTEKPKMDVPAMMVKLSSHTEVGFLAMNTGNVHLRPRGFVYVYDDKTNELVLNVGINSGVPALPNQPCLFSGTVNDYRLPEGRYRAEIALDDIDWGNSLPVEKRKFTVKKDGTVETN